MIEARRQMIASSQQGSYFLRRVPLEIRNEIYQFVLGGQRIHMMYPMGRTSLHHVKGKKIYGPPDVSSRRVAERSRTKIIVGIALLETSRQIHAEAVGILYSSSVVSMNRWHLASTTSIFGPRIMNLAQSRLCQIQRLEVDWRFDELPTEADIVKQSQGKWSEITWTTHWRTVAEEMPRLRVLYVRIEFREPWKYPRNGDCQRWHPTWNVGDEMHWTAPMLKIKSLKICKIFLKTAYATPFILLEDQGASMCSPTPQMCIQKCLDSYPRTENAWIDMLA